MQRPLLLYGVAVLPAGPRREELERAVMGMLQEDFAGRLLLFECAAAYAYATVAVERRIAGRPPSQFDAQIAAICRSGNAVRAPRNTTDFERCSSQMINPWGK